MGVSRVLPVKTVKGGEKRTDTSSNFNGVYIVLADWKVTHSFKHIQDTGCQIILFLRMVWTIPWSSVCRSEVYCTIFYSRRHVGGEEEFMKSRWPHAFTPPISTGCVGSYGLWLYSCRHLFLTTRLKLYRTQMRQVRQPWQGINTSPILPCIPQVRKSEHSKNTNSVYMVSSSVNILS